MAKKWFMRRVRQKIAARSRRDLPLRGIGGVRTEVEILANCGEERGKAGTTAN
jgi:hypothetical protein